MRGIGMLRDETLRLLTAVNRRNTGRKVGGDGKRHNLWTEARRTGIYYDVAGRRVNVAEIG